MKRLVDIFFYLNLLIGILILGNYIVTFMNIYISIPLLIVIFLSYLFIAYLYRKRASFSTVDVIFWILYIIYFGCLFVFSSIYQIMNSVTFNMMYFSGILYISHILAIVFGLIKRHHDV